MIVQSTYHLPTQPKSIVTLTYSMDASGAVDVEQCLQPGAGLPIIPEVGVRFELDASFQDLRWYGKGPHETYWDRQASGKITVHKGKVEEQLEPYLRPQESGNKTEVRWLDIRNDQARGIKISGAPVINVNANAYSPFELEEADHHVELEASDKVNVRVSGWQMGVGGDDSWGQRVHPEYTLFTNRNYRFGFRIQPIVD
ncbi:beta-galactosidase small subunit [Gracilibacillus halophilus]|uniref:beta-galactosidase small subunit n=1 Tax=Gracilibacillus halophilus TaxID=470864 RepID=UPI00039F4A2C